MCYTFWHIETETNGRHFADDFFSCVFLNETVWISLNISLKFISKSQYYNIGSENGDKTFSEPMMFYLLPHICVIRPQWVKRTMGDSRICRVWFEVHPLQWRFLSQWILTLHRIAMLKMTYNSFLNSISPGSSHPPAWCETTYWWLTDNCPLVESNIRPLKG